MQRTSWVRSACMIFLTFVMVAAGSLGAQEKAKKMPPPDKPIDINSANFDQLHSLPGVGPVTAQRILDYRKKSGPFLRIEDLLAVRGISSTRFEKIKQYVMVKPADAAPAKTPSPAKAATPPKKQPPAVSHQSLNSPQFYSC